MLSQTGGTLGAPVNLGYDEVKHYKMPQAEGVSHAVTGLLTLTRARQRARRGRLELVPALRRPLLPATRASLEAVLDAEGLAMAPGESWELEELFFATGPARAPLLGAAGRADQREPPAAEVRQAAHRLVLLVLLRPEGDRPAGDRQPRRHRQAGAGPAVRPDRRRLPAGHGRLARDRQGLRRRHQGRAQADPPARLRAGHLGGAVHRRGGLATCSSSTPTGSSRDAKASLANRCPSNEVTFGGWRRGPWYALDGTHPEVQQHFETLFRTMRKEWGCTYFKLDANFWGAMHGGALPRPQGDPHRGLPARDAGHPARARATSFVLGCNHPIWGSFGLIHGSRSSGDVKRTWTGVQEDHPPEPRAGTGRTAACGGTTRTPWC